MTDVTWVVVVLKLETLLSSGGLMVMGVCGLGMSQGCCGSEMSQYLRPKLFLMGIAAIACVHKVSGMLSSLNNPYHWLFKNSMGSNSLVGEYFLRI